MLKADQEIEKMLLESLKEIVTMGWPDSSEKVLLLELIGERLVKNLNEETETKPQTKFNCPQNEFHYASCNYYTE